VIEVVDRHLASAANVEAIIAGRRTNLAAIVQPSVGAYASEGGEIDIFPEPSQVDAVEIEAAPSDRQPHWS
jgi:hypothetical protein